MGFGGSGEVAGTGRAGALVLSLLATPLAWEVLDELSRGPRRLTELRRQTGSPQTTLRARLKQLADLGVVARRRLNPFPSVREYELTNLPGRELLFVVTTLEAWLASAPDVPLTIGSEAGRAAIRAVAESWSSSMLRELADGPTSSAELERELRPLGRAPLERRLDALRAAGLVTGTDAQDGDASYEITDWLRKGTGSIAAAARWEHRHIPHDSAPIRPVDAEAGFLLAVPLLKPPLDLSGSCRLGVEFGEGRERCLAGVTVEVGAGRVISCTTRLASNPAAWATGPPGAWLRTTIEANPNRLDLGGDRRLVRGVVEALNQALFGPARPLPPPP